jgi:hypothetical protein
VTSLSSIVGRGLSQHASERSLSQPSFTWSRPTLLLLLLFHISLQPACSAGHHYHMLLLLLLLLFESCTAAVAQSNAVCVSVCSSLGLAVQRTPMSTS